MTNRKPNAPKPEVKTAPETPEPAPSATPRPPEETRRTIRSICEEGLLAGVPYKEIIANVKATHPTASTSQGCIAWYRSKMVKKGLLPSGKELAAARKRAAAETAGADHLGEH